MIAQNALTVIISTYNFTNLPLNVVKKLVLIYRSTSHSEYSYSDPFKELIS